MRYVVIACAMILAPSMAMAGQPEAAACASTLDAKSKLVFDATIGQVNPGVDLKSVLTSNTKKLVMAGHLQRAVAREAATAAAECLKLASQ